MTAGHSPSHGLRRASPQRGGQAAFLTFIRIPGEALVPAAREVWLRLKRRNPPTEMSGDLLLVALQQPDAGFFAGFYGCLVPDTGLDFADVAAAHHQHTKAALADTAADGQRQLVI